MAANGAKAAQQVAKVGRIRRIGQYFGNILNDYKMVAQETFQDIADGSIKASVYLTSLVAAGILIKSNPSEADLENALLESAHELSLVGTTIRNKESDAHIDNMRSAHRDGKLHHTSLGLFSLVWVSEHRDELDLYEAKCKHTNVPWYQWHKQVIDVGVLGKFVHMSRKMQDFDVNEDEWKDKTSSS
ncbi:mitochondrial import inner membrane translocase subunit Tim29 [Aplysia californica]|uniref:Mitochondrial import inner membrane translocase subunit Tim29 n=1 Tax=Aplysia californica TaxID=6500 RepID=A0ABM0JMF5_APLCA|nr:mitochondrial import inner membrane translocase subunit Tim29 [Aplysia californica]